ncbi:SRPBCC family protein [Chitinophagaceae bacterium MMS25-I14]
MQYSFITKWQIKAPIAKVWDALYHSEEWPEWWKGCIQAERIADGNSYAIGSVWRYTWKGFLPYKLSFDICVTDRQEHKMLRGTASGNLTGTGTWLLEENGAVTDVVCYWNVRTSKVWMNYLSFLLRPVFKLNHNYVMRKGEEGLLKRLEILRKIPAKTEFTLPILGV